MAHLSRLFDRRSALVVVKPDTLIRWHRKGFWLFWRWKSKPAGRPALAKNLQELIRKKAAENPTWGEEHIANELKLKLGVRVSPRTVRKYLANYRGRTHEYIKDTESGCEHDEKVARHNGLGMIVHEGQPSLTRIRRAATL